MKNEYTTPHKVCLRSYCNTASRISLYAPPHLRRGRSDVFNRNSGGYFPPQRKQRKSNNPQNLNLFNPGAQHVDKNVCAAFI